MCSPMGRPRIIAPDGDTVHTTVRISETLAEELRREAEATGRSMGAVIRDRLQASTEARAS